MADFHLQESERAVRDLLRRRGIRLHDSVIAEIATAAERDEARAACDGWIALKKQAEAERDEARGERDRYRKALERVIRASGYLGRAAREALDG